ncbi:MAG TPA: hypothetical protein PLR30_14700, partial [Saprospiraceae bacterium]|nr:hypothetical protein [Saprospiraceae bacterium]
MKRPETNLETIKAYILSIPKRVLTFITTLPHRLITGIKDPAQRKKWFKQGLFVFGGLIGFLMLIFLVTWLGLFGSIPNKKA